MLCSDDLDGIGLLAHIQHALTVMHAHTGFLRLPRKVGVETVAHDHVRDRLGRTEVKRVCVRVLESDRMVGGCDAIAVARTVQRFNACRQLTAAYFVTW